MSEFSFVPLGVGDAFSALYYSSCLLLQADGYTLLIDCPHPIRKILKESTSQLEQSIDIKDIDSILLTHLHADHCSGLEGFAFFSYFVLQQKVQLAAHPTVAEHLWEHHLAGGMAQLRVSGELAAGVETLRREGESISRSFDDFFVLHELSKQHAVQIGPFSIECRETLHHVPTTALRISVGGRTLGYSADTAFDLTLIDWLEDADLIIHETNYGTHTPYKKLLELPKSIKDKMKLIHYPDDFDISASEIEPLRPGHRVQV